MDAGWPRSITGYRRRALVPTAGKEPYGRDGQAKSARTQSAGSPAYRRPPSPPSRGTGAHRRPWQEPTASAISTFLPKHHSGPGASRPSYDTYEEPRPPYDPDALRHRSTRTICRGSSHVATGARSGGWASIPPRPVCPFSGVTMTATIRSHPEDRRVPADASRSCHPGSHGSCLFRRRAVQPVRFERSWTDGQTNR